MSWTAMVAMKRLGEAKSRLRGFLSGVDHHAFVLAMAQDTVAAALACGAITRVVVVTSDAQAAAAFATLGADVLPDIPDAGLNPALAYAATIVRPRTDAGQSGLLALPADLPALRPADLAEALTAAARTHASANPRRAFVADGLGTGTVMLAAPPTAALEPCFGPGSAAAHAASGALALAGGWRSLRQDVDTAADLAEAVALGLGQHTERLLRAAR